MFGKYKIYYLLRYIYKTIFKLFYSISIEKRYYLNHSSIPIYGINTSLIDNEFSYNALNAMRITCVNYESYESLY